MLIYFKRISPCFIGNYTRLFSRIEQCIWRRTNSRRKFILWNNKAITIDQKTLFWKTWFERGIYYVQDLLNEKGKFLSLDEFNVKFGLKANYLQYFQITAAIPSSLKQAALLTPIFSEFLFSTRDLLYLSERTTLSLSKMRCKHYYKLFNECSSSVSEPTGIKKMERTFPKQFS